MSTGTLLSRLAGVRQTGAGKWIARCPSHEDRSPSLSIRETGDGRVLLHCFGGCAAGDVLGAAGLEFRDLFPERPADETHRPRYRRPSFDPLAALHALAHEALIVATIGEQLVRGDGTNESLDRLTLAVGRIHRALDAIEPQRTGAAA